MVTHSSIPAWRTLWIEEPGGLRSNGVAKSQTRLSNAFTFNCPKMKFLDHLFTHYMYT